MIEGYVDLRNELCMLLGDNVTDQDIDEAVDAIINQDRVTATAALGELGVLAQTKEGKEKMRSMLADWITHERHAQKDGKASQCASALNHLLVALKAERRHAVR